jgi:hypothetical protein
MTAKIIPYTEDDKPVTAAGAPVPASEDDSGQEVVTMGQLMQLLADTQKNMQDLQAIYSSFNVAKVTDPKTGAITYQSFQQIQGDKLNAAAQKASDDFQAAYDAQQKAQHKSKILKIFGLAFAMVIAVAVAVGSGGAASPLLMLAITTATTAMAAAGQGDPFQMLSGVIATALVKAGMNDKAAHLVADLMVTTAMVAVAGGGSAAAGARAGLSGAQLGMQVVGSSLEMESQMLMETGAVSDAAAYIADATGMDPNGPGFKALEACLTIVVLAKGISGGIMSTQAASGQSAQSLGKFFENPTKVRMIANIIQTGASISEAGFNVGAGITTIQDAQAGYDASTAEADVTGFNAQSQSVNSYGKILEDALSTLVSDLGGQMTSMSRNIDAGFAQKI